MMSSANGRSRIAMDVLRRARRETVSILTLLVSSVASTPPDIGFGARKFNSGKL
jgi:hypothetical protein